VAPPQLRRDADGEGRRWQTAAPGLNTGISDSKNREKFRKNREKVSRKQGKGFARTGNFCAYLGEIAATRSEGKAQSPILVFDRHCAAAAVQTKRSPRAGRVRCRSSIKRAADHLAQDIGVGRSSSQTSRARTAQAGREARSP